jgi:glucose/arabinose dehydrogenase
MLNTEYSMINAQVCLKRMTRASRIMVVACIAFSAGFVGTTVRAEQKVSDYYVLESLPLPEGAVVEVGGLEWLPDGRLAVSTRRGEIWMADGTLDDVSKIKWKRYAHGLHEVLGLAYNKKDGALYATQRGEITKILDRDGDGEADSFETFCDEWGINGNYHEYAFGSRFDPDGNLWIVLCLTGSGGADKNTPWRGWSLRIDSSGKAEPICSGVRSPGGIGMDHLGRMYYSDNQGLWTGTSCVKYLKPGHFTGNPTGNIWYDLAPNLERPEDPKSDSRIHIEAEKIPLFVPPVAQLPHSVLGKSTSGILCDETGGKFGPFGNQLFVYDQSFSNVVRLYVEEVNGVLQSAAFRFMEAEEGFGSGNLVGVFAPDGSMFVGGTNRGWGSRGKKTGAVDRVRWTKKVPFEALTMQAKPDGFELTFTNPIDKASAESLEGYAMEAYTYVYKSGYGSPVVDKSVPKVTGVRVVDDKTVRVVVDGLVKGHVHTLEMKGLRSKGGLPLLHNTGYYTLNQIPK